MAKVGDIVRFLNAVGGGKITKIKDNIAYVEDADGFETPVLMRECVVVGTSAANTAVTSQSPANVKPTSVADNVMAEPQATSEEVLEKIEETPMGDKLNVVLAYEPTDLKHLSQSKFDTYLVNDSNYYLYFTYLTRKNSDVQWINRYDGVVEPNIQVFLGQLATDDLSGIDRVAVQFIAFKRGKDFDMKSPVSVEFPFEAVKFAKLHCFRDNMYFDLPVIAHNIVTNDSPERVEVVDVKKLHETMMATKKEDDRRHKVVVKKQPKKTVHGDTIVVDLHISELVDNIRGLSNGDMLNLQIDEFSRVMDENLKNKGTKIVFIHGKGEGVLRNALMKELTHRYKGHDVQDASFREYGFGATQVTIR
ncbi:MAG: DUF2027 domain-containing protein [Paramuribaculum sp.]|nr:DUF2027 domain-containing protein [Paramuribaculum sp.]